jgi:predicted enzyme related to lactoylglutathione lyase
MTERPGVGTIGWVDLTVDAADAVRDFYSDVVGWKAEPVIMGQYVDYNMTTPDGGVPAAGVCHRRDGNAHIPPVWMVYFVVADLEESIAKVRARGGEVVAEPRRAGNTRYAMFKDPAGAVAALVQQE